MSICGLPASVAPPPCDSPGKFEETLRVASTLTRGFTNADASRGVHHLERAFEVADGTVAVDWRILNISLQGDPAGRVGRLRVLPLAEILKLAVQQPHLGEDTVRLRRHERLVHTAEVGRRRMQTEIAKDAVRGTAGCRGNGTVDLDQASERHPGRRQCGGVQVPGTFGSHE